MGVKLARATPFRYAVPMKRRAHDKGSAPSRVVEVAHDDRKTHEAAVEVLSGGGKRRGIRSALPFLGPAFIASVAYIDPGNFATNISSGARFGYTLLWVIVASNLTAMLIQSLSAKLGIVTGQNLAEVCRARFPRPAVWVLWVLMELVAIATDLAEFLGAAIGFNLLFGMPLWVAGFLTAVTTFLILALERRGFRKMEAIITGLVGIVAVCYVVEIFLSNVKWRGVAAGAVLPQFATGDDLTDSIVLAVGILGATVMPHVIFLHSALTQGRIRVESVEQQRMIFRYEILDVVIAMGLAGFVNAAMLIMAAATFHEPGLVQEGKIEEAYLTLQHTLGPLAKYVFGISLLAAGLSSSAVGTMSGQVIMQGFLNFHVPVWVRRAVTMAPALAVIFMGFDPTRTLVFSQVILSLGLPFAIIPLVIFTARKSVMGPLANHKAVTAVASTLAAMIVMLNLYLLVQLIRGGV